jgi:hypothetical protein
VDIISIVATGHEAPVIVACRSEEELEKRLGAMLLAGDAIISFDNCDHELGGALLNQALTQLMVKVRVLGRSETPTLPSCALMCATGNNLVVEGDLTRRSLMARLDPGCERPELRVFQKPDPVLRAKADRPLHVRAALTVLRSYIVAGSPSVRLAPLGGFEQWSRVVRDALVWLGMDDPVATQEELRGGDPDIELMLAMIEAWETTIGLHAPVTAGEVARQAEARGGDWDNYLHPELRDACLAVAGRGAGRIDARSLGKWLGHKKDKLVGERKFVLGGRTGGSIRWSLVTVRSAAAVIPEG